MQSWCDLQQFTYVEAYYRRCSQFQRGCLYNEALLNTLQLPSRKDHPTAMLVLLREVRAAEAL